MSGPKSRLPLRSLEEAEAVQRHSALVQSIVNRYIGRGVDREDLFQLGCIGLIKALREFDPALGNRFSTYAVPKIAGEIRRFLRDDGPVKVGRSLKEQSNRVAAAARRLSQELGREPRISELCAATGLDAEQVAACTQASRPVKSLEEPAGEEGPSLGDTLGSGEEDRLVERLALRGALDKLEPTLRAVLVLRYFRDLTQQKTAERLGVSQVQVSRLEKKALLAMRRRMG